MSAPELDNLADAITAVAGARNRIPTDRLLREAALNILILARIASNRLQDKLRRDDIESAADHLVTQLRHAAWELPAPLTPPPSPPSPSLSPPRPAPPAPSPRSTGTEPPEPPPPTTAPPSDAPPSLPPGP